MSKKGLNKTLIYFLFPVIIIGVVSGGFFLINKENISEIEDVESSLKSSSPQNVVIRSSNTLKDCGDNICGIDEAYGNCPSDCIETCGNSVVEDDETMKNCRIDLLSMCGDGICQEWEHYEFCGDCEECVVDPSGRYTGENKCKPNMRSG